MQNIISFIDSNSNIKNIKAELIFYGLFEGETFANKGKNNVSKAISLESFKGKYRKKHGL